MDIVDKMRVMADDVGGDLVWCDEAADTIEALRVTMLEECSKRGHLMAEAHELRQRIAELETKERRRNAMLRDIGEAFDDIDAARKS